MHHRSVNEQYVETPSKTQTDKQTNGQTPVIEFRACQPKNVTSGGNNCNDFPDNKLTKCRAFIG